MKLNNYANYKGYAPEGCTSLTTILNGEYNFWKRARADGSYEIKKRELAEQVIESLEDKLPDVKGKAEIWDIATPLTYERYCDTYHGSWMTIQPPGYKQIQYSCKP